MSKEEEVEQLRQAILQRFTGTKVSVSDRNMYLAGAKFGFDFRDKSGWIDCKTRLPELIKGKDYSENVLAVINGELGVACFCYIDGGDRQESGFAWANCYNDLDGNAEFDDEYDVTYWMPKPIVPPKI